jgi:hypothetical protein
MSIIRLMIATTVASALLMTVMVTPVLADTTAEQNQNLDVECDVTSSSYGQSSANCRAKGEQRQLIKTREGLAVHKVLDTGLDSQTMSVVFGTLSAGALALVAKRKLNA